MSQLLESAASSEPTPPGTSDPLPADGSESITVATRDEQTAPPPTDPLEDLQKRQHPFGD